MKSLRHILTAIAAQIPCRVEPQFTPAYSCDCGERFADEARRWDEGLMRHIKRAGFYYSSEIGHA